MTPTAFWVALIGSAVATYIVRAVFLVPDATRPPRRIEPMLRLVAPAVLAALAVPGILRTPTGAVDAARLVAGGAAFAVALRTRSVLATIIVGFAVLFGLGWLTG